MGTAKQEARGAGVAHPHSTGTGGAVRPTQTPESALALLGMQQEAMGERVETVGDPA